MLVLWTSVVQLLVHTVFQSSMSHRQPESRPHSWQLQIPMRHLRGQAFYERELQKGRWKKRSHHFDVFFCCHRSFGVIYHVISVVKWSVVRGGDRPFDKLRVAFAAMLLAARSDLSRLSIVIGFFDFRSSFRLPRLNIEGIPTGFCWTNSKEIITID